MGQSDSTDTTRSVMDLLDLEKQNPCHQDYRSKTSSVPRFSSGRPRTNLIGFCKCSEKDVSTLSPDSTYLPVVRYPGLYYPKDDSHLGCFYFFERESRILLDLGRSRTYGSKAHALLALSAELLKTNDQGTAIENGIKLESLNYRIEQLECISGWSFVKRDLKLEESAILYEQFMRPFYETVLASHTDSVHVDRMKTSMLYPYGQRAEDDRHFSSRNMWAGVLDFCDQPICAYARALGIDTIILQRVSGEERCVTEILDVRTESYPHLVRIQMPSDNPIPASWFPSNPNPTIWYSGEGFISAVGNQGNRACI
jgi:hypothetical protein